MYQILYKNGFVDVLFFFFFLIRKKDKILQAPSFVVCSLYVPSTHGAPARCFLYVSERSERTPHAERGDWVRPLFSIFGGHFLQLFRFFLTEKKKLRPPPRSVRSTARHKKKGPKFPCPVKFMLNAAGRCLTLHENLDYSTCVFMSVIKSCVGGSTAHLVSFAMS